MSSRLVERDPTISATLRDGPLEGRSIEVGVIEARPPKTLDVPVDDTTTYRYCLAEWGQSGASAVYTSLVPRLAVRTPDRRYRRR